MELQKIIDYILTKEVENKLLTKKSKKRNSVEVSIKDLKPVTKDFKISATYNAIDRKTELVLVDSLTNEIVFKDVVPCNFSLFGNSYAFTDIASALTRYKKGFEVSTSCNYDYDYEDENEDDDEDEDDE